MKLFALCAAGILAGIASLRATDVVLVGTVQYQITGSTVVLSANQISNESSTETSGTLRLELWAFSSPYSGSAQQGYLLAQYTLQPLKPNYYYPALSETVAYTAPPDGTWSYALLLTEYTGASTDDGYSVDNYADFSGTVQIGPVSPPPTNPVTPPTNPVTPPVSPVTTTGTARLTNLSVRSETGPGSQSLAAGLVISGTGTKSVLFRGDGPSLAEFGVAGFLPDPLLTVYNGQGAPLATNAAWGGSAALSQLFGQVGAYSLPAGSRDAAAELLLPAGTYTTNITSTSGDDGVALAEVYDADVGTPTSRLINLSARSVAGSGAQTLTTGFVISGTGTETVLVRGDGPALGQFGVADALASPQLTLFDSGGSVIATNAGWGNLPVRGSSDVQATLSQASASVFSKVGAFALSNGSADSALVATLPAGAYTAQVTGMGQTTGVALVELYEVPQAASGSVPTITVEPTGQSITSGGTDLLSVTAPGATAFQWYMNGSPIPGATSSTYSASTAGTYTVVATNGYGSVTSAPAVVSVAGNSGTLTGAPSPEPYPIEGWVVSWDNSPDALLGLSQPIGITVVFSANAQGVISSSADVGGGAITGTGKQGAPPSLSGTEVEYGTIDSSGNMYMAFAYQDNRGYVVDIDFTGSWIEGGKFANPPSTYAGIATISYANSETGASGSCTVGWVAAFPEGGSTAPPGL